MTTERLKQLLQREAVSGGSRHCPLGSDCPASGEVTTPRDEFAKAAMKRQNEEL